MIQTQYFMILWLWVFSYPLMAATFGEAQRVYTNIVRYNHIFISPHLILNPSLEINAKSSFFVISINQGMLNFVHNQDELAMVLGHELAHFTAKDMGSNYAAEYRADMTGAIYAATAGYNRCNGAKMFLTLRYSRSRTHPSSINRYNRIKCANI